MPRGAIPTPRSVLAASEPYHIGLSNEKYAPSGHFPSPNHELASARPFRASGPTPESWTAWPIRIGTWKSKTLATSNWAEEAFAKACAEPRIFIPPEVVEATARACGSSNFSAFMQQHGFRIGAKAYLSGPYFSIDWTNAKTLNSAIATVGPVKIVGACREFTQAYALKSSLKLSEGSELNSTHAPLSRICASVFGYGPTSMLLESFNRHGMRVDFSPRTSDKAGYVIFVGGTIGLVDRNWLLSSTSEAWVRDPITIIEAAGE